jgi:diacylglycerol kinase (ATP)
VKIAERMLVLANPSAGGGRAGKVCAGIADLFAKLGVHQDMEMARSRQDLQGRARGAAAAGYAIVVALGGDGTFHDVVGATLGQDISLGFLPAGSGKDIAAGLGIPRDVFEAVRSLVRSRPRKMDVARMRFESDAREASYAGAGGLGLDAEAAKLVNTKLRWLPGRTRYAAGALLAWRKFRPVELYAEMDGKIWKGRVMLAAIANAPSYGAGLRIAPGARMDDGLLDVTIVGEMPLARLMEALPLVFGAGEWRWDGVWRFRARRVRLAAEPKAAFQGDGEILGESPLEAEALAGAIRVFAPEPART